VKQKIIIIELNLISNRAIGKKTLTLSLTYLLKAMVRYDFHPRQ